MFIKSNDLWNNRIERGNNKIIKQIKLWKTKKLFLKAIDEKIKSRK